MINRSKRTFPVLAGAVCAFTAAPAFADFAGQTILGPLTAGSSVSGTTVGASDNNDGWDSGTHIFDIWDGGDNVYALTWLGGDINLTLTSFDGSDNDLFLYTPGNLNEASVYSIRGADDTVQLLGAAAGTYYIVVDSTFFSEGAYQLDVGAVPAPGALALLGVAGMATTSRRRRRHAATA